jgi:hypothetical protein
VCGSGTTACKLKGLATRGHLRTAKRWSSSSSGVSLALRSTSFCSLFRDDIFSLFTEILFTLRGI